MARMTILGAVFLPSLPPERLRSVAQAADEAGLEELWLWEDCFQEAGMSSAAAALAWTTQLRVGVGLFPVPLRNVALTAMELATLERMFPGRVTAVLGHGVQEWMGQVGARVESPLTLLREHAVALRALLAGETVSTDGRYVTLDRVALDWPPARAQVLIGATGPKTLELAGEIGDGVVLTGGTSPDQVRASLAHVAVGAADRPRPDVVVYLMAATGAGADERLLASARFWKLDVDEDYGVAGDAAAVAAAVRRHVAAGADRVVLQPTADEPDPEGFMRFVAQEVRPLVD